MSSSFPHDLSRASWHVSSHSKDADTCVEVAQNLPGIVAVRDSVDPAGPALVFSPQEWRSFTAMLNCR
jgi:Domain of unknown function (DUF397)